ncbi:flavodoxin [Streptomyces sp. NPDC002680]|uniref:flavodoxin n=1 Tax=Streptomyces sp. NPDC002680 TaxID=3364659 RepID=UPI0036C04219
MSELWRPSGGRQGADLGRRGFLAAAGGAGLTLVGCSNSTQDQSSGPTANPSMSKRPQRSAAAGGSGVLIAYFSRTGNTRTVAEYVAGEANADLVPVVPRNSYPEDYDATNDRATEEQDSDARPRLSTRVENMADYTTVLLGYPIWWSTMPMAMFTFLEEYDFNGKIVIPFCTHEGSGLAGSERDIAKLCPGAQLRDGLAVRGPGAQDSRGEVASWVQESGLSA